MIASHYAEPAERRLAAPAELRSGPSDDSEAVQQLEPGDSFLMLDDSVGWAWGYAGEDRIVGYVPSDSLASQ